MNELPPPTGARYAPSHPVVFRATNPAVRDPDRLRRDGPPLRARRRRSGARPDEATVDQPARIRRPAMPPPVSRPRLGPAEQPPESDDRLRGRSDRRAVRRCSPTTRSGIRPAANMRSNFKDTCACGVSVWPTGAPVSGSARTRHGPRIAANPSSRRCSPICGRTAFCFHRRRCWSESGWPRVHARERRPSRRSRPGCPIRSGIRSTGLLAVDPELRRSRFAWLRDYSESPAPSNIVALLDRLEYARGLGIDPARAGRIHAARLARLIDEGAIMTVQHIADLEPARRTAILTVQAASLETRLSDATLAMFEKYMGTLFSRARNRDERRFQATRRDVARALILFRRTIAALRHAKEAGEDGVAVVEREIGMKQLDGVLPVIGAVADVADQDILVTAAERYSVLRRFSPRFLAAFDFRSNTPNDPVLAAVELLRAMDRDGTRVLPKRPPSSFLPPQWRKLIFANGAADRRLYETAVLATLRERLRGSNIWVAGSRDYRAFEDYLLPAEAGARHRHRRRDRSRPLHRQPHGGVARAPDLRGRARRARRTRRGRDRGRQTLHRPHPARRPRGRARSGSAVERNAASGADHRGSERCRRVDRIRRTGSCICAPAIPPPTNRRCWRRCSPTAPIWASPAWPTRRAASATIISSTWRNGTSATTTTSPRAPPSSTRTTGIRWRRSGTTGQPRRRTASTSGPEAARARAVPSMPNTASTPARCSTRTCPAIMDRSTHGSFRRR